MVRQGLILLILLLGGCGGSSDKCTPGMSVACTGAGGCSGGQACKADGTYDVCLCGSPDAAPAVDAGTVDAAAPDAFEGPFPICDSGWSISVSAACATCLGDNCCAQFTVCMGDMTCMACLAADPSTPACQASMPVQDVVAC